MEAIGPILIDSGWGACYNIWYSPGWDISVKDSEGFEFVGINGRRIGAEGSGILTF